MFHFNFSKRGRLLKTANEGVALLDLSVKNIMTDYVITISSEKSAIDAATMMIGEDVSAIVVEQNTKPIGILTERDFITKVPASPKVFKLKVKDIMSCFGGKKAQTCAIESVKPVNSLLEVHNILQAKHIRKLVVTTDEGLLAGIITQSDLSKAIVKHVKIVAPIDAPFLVKEVMSKKISSIAESAGFKKAKELMMKKNLSTLPVTTKKEYVGIFTEYDVVMQFYDAGGKLNIKALSEIMKSPIKVVSSEVNIFDANLIMHYEKVRRLMVVDENKKVCGIVSQTDLVHACYDYLEKLKAHLQSRGSQLKKEDFFFVKPKSSIVSQYTSEHLRAYAFK